MIPLFYRYMSYLGLLVGAWGFINSLSGFGSEIGLQTMIVSLIAVVCSVFFLKGLK